MSHKRKKKNIFLIYLEYYSIVLLISIFDILPLRISYFLGNILADIFFLLDFKHRKRIIKNLLHAGAAENATQAKEMAKLNFKHFAKVAIEIVKFNSIINQNNIHEYINFSGDQEAINYILGDANREPGQGIIITGHFGNWEIAGTSFTLLTKRPMLSIMREFDNPKIGEFIEKRRKGSYHSIRYKKGAIKALINAVKKGHSVCMVADQHASSSEGSETIFYGHPARSHVSPSSLHLKTGIPIVVGGLKRINNNFRFEFVIIEKIEYKASGNKEDDLKKITQLYTSAIEKLVRNAPEQWMWAHRRWLDCERKTN